MYTHRFQRRHRATASFFPRPFRVAEIPPLDTPSTMPARRRAPSTPTSPRADGMDPSNAPDRLGAPSPAPLPEEQSPETCDAQFELLAENVNDLRDAVAALIARKSETATQREDAVERCVEIIGRLRGAQRRAMWGLEHLNAQTRGGRSFPDVARASRRRPRRTSARITREISAITNTPRARARMGTSSVREGSRWWT